MSSRAKLALGAVAVVLLAALLLPLAAPTRAAAPTTLTEIELGELNDRMDRIRERSLSDQEIPEPEQAAALAYVLFKQFKKGGFARFFSTDPDQALRCRSLLGSIDPEADRLLVSALSVFAPQALSPDLEMGQTQVANLSPEQRQALKQADQAFSAHLPQFASRLLGFCRKHQLPPGF